MVSMVNFGMKQAILKNERVQNLCNKNGYWLFTYNTSIAQYNCLLYDLITCNFRYFICNLFYNNNRWMKCHNETCLERHGIVLTDLHKACNSANYLIKLSTLSCISDLPRLINRVLVGYQRRYGQCTLHLTFTNAYLSF